MAYQPTVLVTGFEPFFTAPRNPSWEAVALLPEEMAGCRIIRKKLPVRWFDCVYELEQALEQYHPRAVIAFGQGYPALPILIERVGVNLCSGPDNSGVVDMHEEPLYPNGPAAYFSTFPYAAIHARLKQENIPVRYSYSAGINQCNCILYSALHFAATRFPNMTAGFIHLPMLPDAEKNITGVPLETTAHAVYCSVAETAKSVNLPVRTLDDYRECL